MLTSYEKKKVNPIKIREKFQTTFEICWLLGSSVEKMNLFNFQIFNHADELRIKKS